MTETIYECLRCHNKAPLREWERGYVGEFRCSKCGYRVGKKLRPPIVKRVKTR